MTLRLVVGLGNPGDEYRATRHNVGLDVVDRIASALSMRMLRFRARSDSGKTLGQAADDPDRGFALLKPTTYMNLSGVAVAAARDRFQIEARSILIICDDFHLPLGRIRVRPKGSAGGHNGLKSILGSLGTDEFPRVRIGIGETAGAWENFVLTKFTPSERSALEPSMAAASDAVARWCLDGDFDRLMNTLNAPISNNSE